MINACKQQHLQPAKYNNLPEKQHAGAPIEGPSQAVFEQLVAQLQNVVYVLLRIHILRLCNVSVTRSERDLK